MLMSVAISHSPNLHGEPPVHVVNGKMQPPSPVSSDQKTISLFWKGSWVQSSAKTTLSVG